VRVLERSVAGVRTRVQERLWRVLIRGLTPERQAQLDTLLNVGGAPDMLFPISRSLHRIRSG